MKCEINLILITGKIIQTERGGAVCGAGQGGAWQFLFVLPLFLFLSLYPYVSRFGVKWATNCK